MTLSNGVLPLGTFGVTGVTTPVIVDFAGETGNDGDVMNGKVTAGELGEKRAMADALRSLNQRFTVPGLDAADARYSGQAPEVGTDQSCPPPSNTRREIPS